MERARPKTISRAKPAPFVPSILPQEAMTPTYSSHSRLRWDHLLKDHAALLKDEVFNVILGTVNTQHGNASQISKRKSGRDMSEDEVFESDHLPQVPYMLIAGGGHGHNMTFRSPVMRPRSVSSTLQLVPQPLSFNLPRIPDTKTSGKDTDLGNAPFSKEQQDQLLNLIYDNQKEFSLYDKDLGICNKLAYSIPTMTYKPVYLPNRTIP